MTDESQENLIDVLAEDFVTRYRLGERPALTEYVGRYPLLEEEIRELFPTLIMMEQARSLDSGTEGRVSQTPPNELPERLGEYRILREVGRGGMGIVYEAFQESLGRHVALKILPTQSLRNPKHLQRFQREVRAAAKLHHPNIVPVFGAGEVDGVHFYAMQFIQGLALDQVAEQVRRLRSEKKSKSNGGGKVRELVIPGSTRIVNPEYFATTDGRLATRSAMSLAAGLCSGIFQYDLAPSQDRMSIPIADASPHSSADEKREISPPGNSQASQNSISAESRISDTVQESGLAYWHSIARIGIQVAEALQYAADQGVLHRDIKPANLLLDLKGNIWVTDFGLAKSDDSDELTNTGDIVGTLRYLAPERLRGESELVSDIYSLGATLYELLVLKPLFDGVKRAQLLSVIADVDPARPRLIDETIPADLETIVLKAISKDSLDRYSTATELASDLRRFLEDRPVLARRVRPAEQLWRWCRRNRAMAIMMSTLSLLAVTLVAGALITNAIRRERDEAIYQRELAQQARKENDRLLERAQIAERESRVRAHLAKATTIMRSGKEGQRNASLEELRLAAKLHPDETLQQELTDTAISAMRLSDLKPVVEFSTLLNGPSCFDRQGKRFVQVRTNKASTKSAPTPQPGQSAYSDFSLHVCESHDWNKVRSIPGPKDECWYAMPEFSLGDDILIVTYLRRNAWPLMICRNAETHKIVHSASIQSSDIDATIGHHPNGRVIAYQEPGTDLILWDLVDRREVSRFPQDSLVYDISFNSTGTQLAVLPVDGSAIVLLNSDSGEEIQRFHLNPAGTAIRTSLSWSSDDQLLAAGRNDGAIEIWNTSAQTLTSILAGHSLAITHCSFSPRGHLLRTTSWDASSKIWDAAMGRELVSTERHLIDFTSDGRLAYTAGDKLKAGLCSLAHQDHIQVLHDPAKGNSQTQTNENGIRWATFNPDESLLAIHGATFIDFWDVSTRRKLHRLSVDSCNRVLFHPDGSFLLTVLPDGLFRWPIRDSDHETGRTIACGPPEKVPLGISDSAILSDVRWLSDNRRVAIFDSSKPQVLIRDLTLPMTEANACVRLPALYKNIQNLAVSPNGEWLAAGSHHQPTIQIWNLSTLQRHEIIPEPSNPTPGYTVNFSPDSRWLVVAVRKEITESGHLVYETGTWKRHSFRPTTFTPGLPIMFRDLNRLAAMTGPHEVQISDVESGRILSRIFSAESRFNIPVAMIRNNSVMAMISGTGNDDILLWDFGSINQTLTGLGLTMELDLTGASVVRVNQKPITLTVDDGGMVERNRVRALVSKELTAADALVVSGKFDEAVQRIQAIQDLQTSNDLLLNRIAWNLVSPANCQPDHAACAIRLVERALEIQPRESSYWNTMGVARYRNNQYQMAIDALRKSESLAPGKYFVDNAVFLAMSYWQLANRAVARKWLSDAIEAFDQQASPTDELRRFRKDAESLVTPE